MSCSLNNTKKNPLQFYSLNQPQQVGATPHSFCFALRQDKLGKGFSPQGEKNAVPRLQPCWGYQTSPVTLWWMWVTYCFCGKGELLSPCSCSGDWGLGTCRNRSPVRRASKGLFWGHENRMVLFWEILMWEFWATLIWTSKNSIFSSHVFILCSHGKDCIFISVDINQRHK